jgi:hypothetical protein
MASPHRDPGAFRQHATIAPIHEERALRPLRKSRRRDDFGFRDHAPGHVDTPHTEVFRLFPKKDRPR